MRGPIDFIVVKFNGNNFTGNILQELQKVVDNGTVSVLALSVISKNQKIRVLLHKMGSTLRKNNYSVSKLF